MYIKEKKRKYRINRLQNMDNIKYIFISHKPNLEIFDSNIKNKMNSRIHTQNLEKKS